MWRERVYLSLPRWDFILSENNVKLAPYFFPSGASSPGKNQCAAGDRRRLTNIGSKPFLGVHLADIVGAKEFGKILPCWFGNSVSHR